MTSAEQPTLLFVSLAMNQATFFEAVGRVLEGWGRYKVVHASFHEGAVRWLASRGCRVFNPFVFQPADPDVVNFAALGIDRVNILLGHEKAAYEITDSALLERKFKGHLHAMGQVLDTLAEEGRRVVVIQELGGFTSVLAAYFSARARGMDNWFIEPSFFRGRVFFTRNSFAAPAVPGPQSEQVSAEVRAYLDGAIRSRAAVIPVKDRHHYRGAARKLTDPRNFRRLIEKLMDKYIRGQREEFEHIGGHVSRHLRMYVNYLRLRRYYRPLETEKPFVYYPLHVPADFALTIRSPEYLDQYALIDYLARSLPYGYLLLLKEHPALIGAVDQGRLVQLLRQRDNVRLLDPHINNYEVISRADAVVTVNSKAGAEALLLGRPVVVLGDAFYARCALARNLDSLSALPDVLKEAINSSMNLDQTEVQRYFQDVWDASYPGELYDLSKDNVLMFAQSLCKVVGDTL